MTPLPTSSRLQIATERIKNYIVERKMKPGERLPSEEWFANQLNVGRPFIREALKGLEAVGLIESRRGIGRFVSQFDPEDYLLQYATTNLLEGFSEREVTESRCLLEIAAIAGAVERLTEEDHEELHRLLNHMRQHVAKGEQFTEEDFAMHRLIASRSDNRIIAAMIDAVDALQRMRERPTVRVKDLENDLAEHEAIVQAVIARNGEAARAALMNHFDTTARRLGFDPVWRHLSQSASHTHP